MLLATVILTGCGYDRIQELEDRVRAARTDVEAIVQRRVELIPNLVDTARRFGLSDATVIDAIGEARDQLVSALNSSDLRRLQAANHQLSAALDRLLQRSAAISSMSGDPAFQIVKTQLTETRGALESARGEYNRAVRAYNEYIGAFPQAMTARVVRARPMQPLEAWELSSGDAVQTE